jgi:hypothetical protein
MPEFTDECGRFLADYFADLAVLEAHAVVRASSRVEPLSVHADERARRPTTRRSRTPWTGPRSPPWAPPPRPRSPCSRARSSSSRCRPRWAPSSCGPVRVFKRAMRARRQNGTDPAVSGVVLEAHKPAGAGRRAACCPLPGADAPDADRRGARRGRGGRGTRARPGSHAPHHGSLAAARA